MSDRVKIDVYGKPAGARVKRRRGDWVLHRCPRVDRLPNPFQLAWRVVHAPTGLALPYRYTLAEGRRVLRAMYREWPRCLAGLRWADRDESFSHPDTIHVQETWRQVVAAIRGDRS